MSRFTGAPARPGFDPRDPEQVRAVQKQLMLKAEKAREHPADFLEFVLREETTRRPVKCAPHQRIGLDFVLDHSSSVLIWPAGAAKTISIQMLILWLLGKDPTKRWVLFSKTQGQAKKTLAAVKDYIEESKELRLVFPDLEPSDRDSWRQDRIVVKRPRGIRDASVQAAGLDFSVQGSRLDGIIFDDTVDDENVRTLERRRDVINRVEAALSRIEPGGLSCAMNTAWHSEDAIHYLADPKKKGWATLKMHITGDILVDDDARRIAAGGKPWDHPLLRPKYEKGADLSCRIVRPGIDDSKNDVPLFPERFLYLPLEMPDGTTLPPARTFEEAIDRARQDIENKRWKYRVSPSMFAKFYMANPRSDEEAWCKDEWIERCKKAARDAGFFELRSKLLDPSIPTFTGVDLAVSPGEESDDCCFFTFAVLPDRRRLVLDVDVGKFDASSIVKKCIEKHRNYGSVLRIESNAAQDYIRQMVIQADALIPVKPHMTGRAKAHPEHGLPAGFAEMSNGAWLIPNDRFGNCHPNVQRWIDECRYYTPSKHTGDCLMAWYFAREQAKAWGLLAPATSASAPGGMGIAASLLSR
jgi:hypothetical protein